MIQVGRFEEHRFCSFSTVCVALGLVVDPALFRGKKGGETKPMTHYMSYFTSEQDIR